MTTLLRRSSRRHLTGHPWQLGLSLVGIALGVAVVVSIDLSIQSAREAFRVSTETVAGRATHQVTGGPAGLPDSVFTAVRVDAGLRSSAPVVEGWVETPALPGRALRLLGVDPFSEAPLRPWLAGGPSGVDVSTLLTEPDVVVLSEETAAAAGLEPGDTLVLEIGGETRRVRLAGTLEPGGDLARRGVEDLVVADVAAAQELLGRVGSLDRIDLVLPEGPAGEAALAALGDVLPPEARVVTAGARTRNLSEMIRAFDLNLTALSLLALVFGMFLIYNTMTFSVVQRRGLLGSLRALGVTRREVLRLLLGEAAVLGAVGTALGMALGVVLGRGLVRLVTRTINDLYFAVSVEGLALPPEVLLKGALLGIGTTLLASLPPALEAVSVPPRATLTRSLGEDRVRRAVPRIAAGGALLLALGALLLALPSRSLVLAFAGLFGVLLGMAALTPWATVLFVKAVRPLAEGLVGILGTLAARGVVAALSRTAPAVAALVVAVSVTVGLGVMITSFRSTVVRWLDSTLQADVYVAPPSPVAARSEGVLDAELVRRLTALPGVVGHSTYRGTTLETAYGPTRVVALALHPRGERAFTFLGGEPAEVFPAFRTGGAVMVSEPFAYRHRVGGGDTIRLPTPRGEAAFPVAGVFYDYGSDRGVVMMSRRTWDRWWDDPAVTSLGLFAGEGRSASSLAEAVRGAVGPGEAAVVRSNRDLREASLEVFDRTFAITAVLRALAFVVAFIGVFSALMALQLERGRELGVLRANGLTPGQVWQLVVSQTGVLGIVSGLLALPAGIVLALVMVFVVNKRSFGWTLQMELGPEVLLQALGLALAGALLAGVYPAWRMSRTSPALALREE